MNIGHYLIILSVMGSQVQTLYLEAAVLWAELLYRRDKKLLMAFVADILTFFSVHTLALTSALKAKSKKIQILIRPILN